MKTSSKKGKYILGMILMWLIASGILLLATFAFTNSFMPSWLFFGIVLCFEVGILSFCGYLLMQVVHRKRK